MSDIYEIERRYLINFPELEKLEEIASKTEIVQTYLLDDGEWNSNRVRKRGLDGKYTYTHTRKKRLSDLTRIEEEREISEEEYNKLLLSFDPSRNAINKFRYCYEYKGKIFEIDIFSFWTDRAIMEVELESESEEFDLPPQINIIREISQEKRYSNASLALKIPDEEI